MVTLTMRKYEKGDEAALGRLLDRCFGRFETWTADRVAELAAGPGPQIAEMWVALEGSRLVGCVHTHGVPRAGSYVIRELAVDAEPEDSVAGRLLDVVLEHLGDLDPILIRASTPTMAPYPDAYRRRGFTPVRRALTLVWDLTGLPDAPVSEGPIVVGDAHRHSPERLAELYVEGMRPYWEWFLDERGGADAHKERVAAYIAGLSRDGGNEMWLAAQFEGEAVGVSIVSDIHEVEADMGGVYVLPAHRNSGVGSALMRATLSGLQERAIERLVVPETMSFLDSDMPSIRLYKRSGARVRAEYLHLQVDGASVQPGG
ncbi:MAG: GNAT family N-acetyltransferase [Acidimicrobiia bacterium]